MMPCLAQNPWQTQKQREDHVHYEINVLHETYQEESKSTERLERSHGLRKTCNAVDFDNANVTEEELEARLAAFDAVREAHANATLIYKLGGWPQRLALTLTQAILETEVIYRYSLPLCFREVDDDLADEINEADNILN